MLTKTQKQYIGEIALMALDIEKKLQHLYIMDIEALCYKLNIHLGINITPKFIINLNYHYFTQEILNLINQKLDPTYKVEKETEEQPLTEHKDNFGNILHIGDVIYCSNDSYFSFTVLFKARITKLTKSYCYYKIIDKKYSNDTEYKSDYGCIVLYTKNEHKKNMK